MIMRVRVRVRVKVGRWVGACSILSSCESPLRCVSNWSLDNLCFGTITYIGSKFKCIHPAIIRFEAMHIEDVFEEFTVDTSFQKHDFHYVVVIAAGTDCCNFQKYIMEVRTCLIVPKMICTYNNGAVDRRIHPRSDDPILYRGLHFHQNYNSVPICKYVFMRRPSRSDH